MSRNFRTLDDLDVAYKTVLLRVDLNVPMKRGNVEDDTRITRVLPTIKELLSKRARVVLLAHFDRPGGKYDPSMSLSPLIDALADALRQEVYFGVDCIGDDAKEAVNRVGYGDLVLLENLRFHKGEEKNDPDFVKALASLGDLYVNDAFSCSHRAHASVAGLAEALPCAAGRLMQDELESLEMIFTRPERPVAAMVGGAKVSTKLELLENLMRKVDVLMIGGAMANTFLCAQGKSVGSSLCEKDLMDTAKDIMTKAKAQGCELMLPVDVVVAEKFQKQARSKVVSVDKIPDGAMVLDIGPRSVSRLSEKLEQCRTMVWNGPSGAFETSPFDVSTVSLARVVAQLTNEGKLKSVAGGGDTVSALSHAGVAEEFSYLSTAGGAFLEWLEGKPLPGVSALEKAALKEAV